MVPVTEQAGRSLRERLREQRALIAVIVVAELIAVALTSGFSQHDWIDGEVYQLGAKAWVAGSDIYHNLPATESGLRLPFIYPPFAAIVFSPLAWVPKMVAISVIMLISHAALLVTLYVMLSASTFLLAYRDKTVLVTAALLPLATISEPVEETVQYAQINLVLMAFVAVDCLWRVTGERKLPYPRGMLIGLAIGVKLSPAAFLLFFLLRKDFRSIATALVTFVGTVGLGFLLAFGDSQRYWPRGMLATSSVSFGPKFTGDASIYAGNQTIRSLLTKLEVPGMWLTGINGVLCLTVFALAVVGMLHALRQRDLPMAVTINGILALLVSPLSWSHHWVWAIPGLVLLLGDAFTRRNWALLLASALAAGFFVMGPQWKVPQGDGKELEWTLFEHLAGNAYVYFGVVFIVYTATVWWRSRRARQTTAKYVVEPEVAPPVG